MFCNMDEFLRATGTIGKPIGNQQQQRWQRDLQQLKALIHNRIQITVIDMPLISCTIRSHDHCHDHYHYQ